jgi:uncharacterized membrane protein HdeD (DUF308 family)
MTSTTDSPTPEVPRGFGTLGIVVGVSALLFGILLLVWPEISLLVTAVLFGLQLLIAGIVRIVSGIASGELDGGERALSITLGVLVLLAGIFCLRNPGLTLLWIVILVACGWLIEGIIQIVVGFRRSGARLWPIALGLVSIAAAIVILVWPLSALRTFVLLGGWLLIFIGVVTVVSAIMAMRQKPAALAAAPA